MGLFSRRGRAEPRDVPAFDFQALGLPRLGPGAGDDVPVSPSVPEDLADLASRAAPMNPFLLASGREPVALLRLHDLARDEVADLAQAVRDGRTRLVPHYRSMPTFPVLSLSLVVHDRPGSPFTFEGFRNITGGDVQDFLAALGRTGGRGTVHLYEPSAGGVVRLAEGPFVLSLPPVPSTWQPHRTTSAELDTLWQVITLAAVWLNDIPAADRDFDAAVDAYLTENG